MDKEQEQEPRPEALDGMTCALDGCEAPAAWSGPKTGLRCQEHTPIVTIAAKVGTVTVQMPGVELACPECGHVTQEANPELARAVIEDKPVRGICPNCKVRGQVKRQLVQLANQAPNREMRRKLDAEARRSGRG